MARPIVAIRPGVGRLNYGLHGRARLIAGVDDWRVKVPKEEVKARGVRTHL
jgi:hypothetical protein